MRALIIISILSSTAQATYFTNAKGEKLEPHIAIVQGLKGESIVRCQEVVPSANKSGSITFKVKKAKKETKDE